MGSTASLDTLKETKPSCTLRDQKTMISQLSNKWPSHITDWALLALIQFIRKSLISGIHSNIVFMILKVHTPMKPILLSEIQWHCDIEPNSYCYYNKYNSGDRPRAGQMKKYGMTASTRTFGFSGCPEKLWVSSFLFDGCRRYKIQDMKLTSHLNPVIKIFNNTDRNAKWCTCYHQILTVHSPFTSI
jgi:hypothetical protein